MSIRCATNGYRTPRCTTVTAMRLGSYVELRHACCRLLGNDTCCRDSATLRPQRRECPGTPPQVSTKASLRLDVSERSAWWLPPAVRERLLERQRGAVTKSGELLLSCDETRSQARRLLHAKYRSRRDLLFVTRGHRRRATWRSASSGCRRRWTRRAPHAPEVHHLSSPVHDAPESRQLPTTRPSGERRAAGVCRPALVAGDGGEAARAGPGEAAARPQEGEPREQESGVRVGKESDAF
mmetsp:Transcript_50309/g.163008  ORF Transcript_50309/g.163008 Transcript_50309/m.163008 type:complete len:239 (+) Transcript_50309:160-876(+)